MPAEAAARYYLITSDYVGDGDYDVKLEPFHDLDRLTEMMAIRDLTAFDCAIVYGRRIDKDEYGPLFIEHQKARNRQREAEAEARERALYEKLKAKYESENTNVR